MKTQILKKKFSSSYLTVLLSVSLYIIPSQNSALAAESHQASWTVNPSYRLIYKTLFSLSLTCYYALLDSNKQSADSKEWKVDALTIGNAGWRSAFFAYLNNWETVVRDTASQHEDNWAFAQNYQINQVKSIANIATYNSRYEDVICKRFDDFKDAYSYYLGNSTAADLASNGLGGMTLLITNVGWFLFFPALWNPTVTTFYNSRMPNPVDLGAAAFSETGSTIIAHAIYTLSDLALNHLLISIKHTISYTMPLPADLSLLKFADCTFCYFGTNIFGKSGWIGSWLYSTRNDMVDGFCSAWNTLNDAKSENDDVEKKIKEEL